MLKDLAYIRSELIALGLKPQLPERKARFHAEMRNSKLEIQLLQNSVRVEIVLMEEARRNKVGLLNIVHHNNNFFPFGQCYISPEERLVFGFQMSLESDWLSFFSRMIYELAVAAEAYANLLLADFQSMPFEAEEVEIDLRKINYPGLEPPGAVNTLEAGAAIYLVGRALEEAYGKSGAIQMGELEFALVGDFILNVSLEPHSFLRKHSLSPEWYAALRLDVGLLELVDNKLWVLFNKWNYESFMISHGLRYENRRPVATLRTELPGDFVQRPALLLAAISRTLDRGSEVYKLLSNDYRIKQAIDLNLGLGN